MRRNKAVVGLGAAIAAVAGVLVSLPATGAAAGSPITDRTETVLRVDRGVRVSHVSLRSPMPAGSAPHSAACDSIGYLRYRPVTGPDDPQQADAVVIAQQGTFGNATNSDSVARNTVLGAMAKQRSIEYWSLARRGTCLNDDTGFDAAARAGDYRIAVDYYHNGKQVDGRRFAGFDRAKRDPFTAELGLARTVRDQYDLMLHELPDQQIRQTKAFCTGISMGGLVTGMFAAWDFDGDPATTADAGHNQCAGFIAQDTFLPSDPVGLKADPALAFVSNLVVGTTHQAAVAGFRSGALPRTLAGVPALSPASWNLQRLAGLAAHLAPTAESGLLARIPARTDLDLGLRLLTAPSYVDFAAGTNSLRDYRFTNDALLGALVDDNAANIGLYQVSVGALAGGPTRTKTFPLPGQVSQIPVLGDLLSVVAGPTPRVAPTDKRALYTWRNYDDVRGVPFTTPAQEVADMRDLSRQLAQGSPIGYWEENFPVRLLADIVFGFGGARDGDLSAIRYENAARDTTKPTLTVLAADSAVRTASGLFLPKDVVPIPGYTHIDTINAAATQNDGRRDPSGQSVADFVLANTRS